MEKEKVNTYSPDTVLEDFLRTAESESDSSNASTSEFDGPKIQRSASRWTGFLELFRSKSKGHFAKDPLISSLKLSKRFSRSMRETSSSSVMPNPILDNGLSYFKPQWKLFTLSELQTATNNFHKENLIGKGGYAEVHKGRLRNGQYIAVKRLMRGQQDERIGDFLSELGIMAHINHPNTAKLIGYAVDGGLFLVLELSPYGSLANMLHASKQKLEWKIRYKVAIGIAEGILYLHEGGQRRIIHRDIKAANILLTKDLEPQICDFGLAKWLPERWTHLTVSKFEGTFGYLAPEFLMHGIVDEKTDVFAFGVLLLELITGRRALDYSQQSLVIWAKPLLKKNRIRELVDPSLADDYNLLQINLMVLAASLCVQQSSIRRPRINQILLLLRGNSKSLDLIRRCRKPSHWKRYYEELFNAEESKMSRGLSALSLQEQIALEV
ncbi:receptor-like cytosolic serine/threonine-protein kinase RBK2 isoform X1 [Nicotiana tabacum]|uniref:non-specific serine/threonine protein kinase n=2 Tax=Nicotiana tabacum TaxID=4097 RepID=A0A1S4DEA0_TOBAC|nr:receptor-like cytosolic serine/threonine-protein kinase RBK2 isoform X1 [Nicotiana tomentosiformis]XP_009626406.1 receptor-like cytosolic serine/threonine-protein kinase RBK2 isoform X1 [Nicotiana tomentosiformis]XP_016511784.1 PREDICTED: receptor-like cytosolic serine/threonine-protein kinase RBK2 isoform X1 [Nicotiana tabacum]XP_016511785.1 PREDICTED: receptor-like cytosolic serine/threonine-protein kinase RBK2 isoform X1 [Nicotiana tabacum]